MYVMNKTDILFYQLLEEEHILENACVRQG